MVSGNAGENNVELLHAKLNAETARLPWSALQRHFARGVVLRVADGLDLVAVALACARDQQTMVEAWLRSGELAAVSNSEALCWHQAQTELWAVVVAPWVLVQVER